MKNACQILYNTSFNVTVFFSHAAAAVAMSALRYNATDYCLFPVLRCVELCRKRCASLCLLCGAVVSIE